MPKVLKILIVIFITGAVLISGCLHEIKNEPYEETAYNETVYNYSTPGFEIDQKKASTVWEKVKFSDDAQFVIREKNYSVTVFIQSYAKGPSAMEWIVVASSIPKKTEDIKIVIFRLDYQTFNLKRSYYFSYPTGKELTRQQTVAAMEEELNKESDGHLFINESAVVLQDGNYIHSYRMPVGEAFLFSWNEIPGNDYERLESFLHRKYDLGFQGSPRIEKIDENKTIRVFSVKNSITLTINEEKTKVKLKIDDDRADELIANMENGKLNIYQATTDIGATIIFNEYAERTIFHATRAEKIAVWFRFMEPMDEVSGRLIIPGDEINGTKLLPYTDISVESISSPAYRGTSTIAGLLFTAPDYVPNGSEILVSYRTEMLHTDGSLESNPEGFNIIPEKKRLALERMFLFTWSEIPGKDSRKLIEYLERMYFLMDWLKTAKIEKIDNDRTIRVFNETNSILLKLNDEKTKIDLRTGIYAPHELFVKTDNNKLRVYDKQSYFERGNGRLVAYSNLSIKTTNESVEGDYLIIATAKYGGWEIGKNIFSFKIGKGGKKQTPGGKSMTEGSWNIGYPADNPPPLNLTEKAEMTEIALRDPYLKGRIHKLIGVTSEYLDLENYSGFFAVVTVDVGNPDYPGEIIRYIVDREEKKIIGSSSTHRAALEYFRGEAFDEAKGNLTKRWDAWNFPGLWLNPETNTSTETLVIDQNILDNSKRVIEKHNLIYTTYSMPYKFQVFANVNVTDVAISNLPLGGRNIDYASIPTEEKREAYQAIGWQGEKHSFIEGNRIVKVLLEQNASEVKTLAVGESWNMSDGYVLTANSIDAKATTPQAWFMLTKDGTKLYDIVLIPRRLWIYTPENDTVSLFITYFNKISAGPYTDEADFKYTWLRSRDFTEIKEGDTFGIMEVTSIDNGKIELRNKEPIDLAPGSVVNLMGNISIQVDSSKNYLSFHPFKVRQP